MEKYEKTTKANLCGEEGGGKAPFSDFTDSEDDALEKKGREGSEGENVIIARV